MTSDRPSGPTRLILARHGETSANLERRFAGHADSVVQAALSVLTIVAVAVLLRLLVHRAINRLTSRVSDGRAPSSVGSQSARGRGAETMRGIKASLVLASVAVVGLALWAGAFVDQTGSGHSVADDHERLRRLSLRSAGG